MVANPGSAMERELDVRLLRFRSGNGEEDGIELARALLDANRHAEAIEVCADSRSTSIDPVEALLLEGRAWTRQGDLLRSQSSFVRAARLAPKDCRAFHALGEVLLKRGDPDRALAALNRALTLAPEHAEIQRLQERASRLARVAETVSSKNDEGSGDTLKPSIHEGLEPLGMRDTAVPDDEYLAPQASTQPMPAVGKEPSPEGSDRRWRPSREKGRERKPSLSPDSSAKEMEMLRAPLKKPLRSGGTASTRFRESISALRRAIAESSPINSSKPPASHTKKEKKSVAPKQAPAASSIPPAVAHTTSQNDSRSSSFPSLRSIAPGSSAPPPVPARSRKDSISRDEDGEQKAARKSIRSMPFIPNRNKPSEPEPNGASEPPNGHAKPGRSFDSLTPTNALRVKVHVPRLESAAPPDPEAEAPTLAKGAPGRSPAEGFSAPQKRGVLAMEDTQLAPVPEAPTKASKSPRSMRPGAKSGEHSSEGFASSSGEFGYAPVPEHGSFPAPPQAVESNQELSDDRISAETISISHIEPTHVGGKKRSKLLWLGALVMVLVIAAGGLWVWFKMREQKAHALFVLAEKQVLSGKHKDLIEAETSVENAMSYYGSEEVRALAVRIQIQKSLDEGFAGLEKLRTLIEDGASGEQSLRLARALIAFRKGNISEAQQVMDGLSKSPPKNIHLMYLYARLGLELRYEREPVLLQRVAKSHPQILAAQIALGEHAFIVGDIEQANQYIHSVLKKEPQHARARLWSDLLSHQKSEDKPNPKNGAVLDKSLDIEGTTNEVLRNILASEMLLTLREQKKARVQMAEGLEAAGNDPRLLRILSVWQLRQGFPGPAIIAAQKVLEVSPEHMAARLFLAEGLVRRRNGAYALRVLGPLSSKDPEVLSLMARSSLLLGTKRALRASMQSLEQHSASEKSVWGKRHRVLRMWTQARLDNKAARDVRGALGKEVEDPSDTESLKLIAQASVDMRWNALGERAVDALRSAGGVSADMLVLRAQVARASGKTDKAKRSLTKALNLRPWYYEAEREQALLFRETGDLEAAKRELQNLVGREGWDANSPELLTLRIELMRTLIAQDRSTEARSILSNLPLKNRGVPEVRPIEARILLAEGKAKEAVEKLRTVAEAPTASAEALVLYGNALSKTPEWEDSSEQYKKALEVDPKNLDALFGLALSYLRAEAPKTTLRLVEKALSIMEASPSSPADQARAFTLEGRAQLQRRRKYHSDGYKALKKAVAIESAPPEAWYFFGDAADSESEAKKAYKKYLELDPKGRFAERAKRKLAR